MCLAAHNYGYKNNYFENINLLEYGDKIIYCYNKKEKVYRVKSITTISEDDFSFLNLNGKDSITLITCITGLPHYRLCIQAECEG